MAFTDLSTSLQDVLLVNYSFFFKSVLLFGGLSFAIFYLFYWKPEKEKKTVFYSVGMLRIIYTIFSWLILIFSPLMLLLLNPEYELSSAVNTFYPIYLTFIIIGGITLIVDMLYFIPSIMLKFGGLDTGDPKVRKAFKSLKRYFE